MTNFDSFQIPTDDVIVQEGTFAYSFTASGTISGSALVKMAGPMQVVRADSGLDNAIGVAAYYVTKGETVAVYGPGNIVRGCLCSGATVGDDLFVGTNGTFNKGLTYGGLFPCVGVALEPKAVMSIGKILLK
jgi:hypothetical protein